MQQPSSTDAHRLTTQHRLLQLLLPLLLLACKCNLTASNTRSSLTWTSNTHSVGDSTAAQWNSSPTSRPPAAAPDSPSSVTAPCVPLRTGCSVVSSRGMSPDSSPSSRDQASPQQQAYQPNTAPWNSVSRSARQVSTAGSVPRGRSKQPAMAPYATASTVGTAAMDSTCSRC